MVSGPSLYCWSSLFCFIIFFRVCLTSPSLFFKNDTDSLKNLFLRWTLQYLACEIQFSLLEQEQNIYEILGMKEKDLIALTVFKKKKFPFRLWRQRKHIFHIDKYCSALLFAPTGACWESVLRSSPLFSEGPHPHPNGLVRLALFSGEKSREKRSGEVCWQS